MLTRLGSFMRRSRASTAALPLVTNGGFDAGTTGWTLSNGAQISQAVVAGRMQLTAIVATNNQSYQTISGLTAGANYQLTGTAKKLSANLTSARVAVYDTAPAIVNLGNAAISGTLNVEVTGSVTFVAPADGEVTIAMPLVGPTAIGLLAEFDNISLVKL